MRPLAKAWWEDPKPVNPRETTNKILEMIDQSVLDPKDVVLMCLKWMSEDEVAEMAKANELDLEQEEEFADLEVCK